MFLNLYLPVFIAGSFSVLAFPPYGLFFICFFTVSFLLYSLEKSSSIKNSFFIGIAFGLGFLGFGLYWISNALFVIQDYLWLIPIAVIFIPLILSIYYGITCALTYYFNFNKYTKVLAFTSFWVIFEICRTYLFTGFPWLLMGYSYGFSNNMSQLASVVGVFGLSILAVLTFSTPYILFSKAYSSIWFAIIIGSLNLLSLLFGVNILSSYPGTTNDRLRIVQPSIYDTVNWNNAKERLYLEELISLSNKNISSNINYIVWPEIPIPYNLFNYNLRNFITSKLPINTILIANSLRYEPETHSLFNSAVIVRSGEIIDYFDKTHLVPFGEYIPFKSILPIKKITDGIIDYTPGKTIKTMEINNLKISMLICYESFFPNQVIDNNSRPDLIINLTNDVWYGNSTGPYQHFEMTRFRAIEEGIPIIRAANNGISAFIDINGRISELLGLDDRGYIEQNIPFSSLNFTLYSKYGKSIPLTLIIIMLLMTIFYIKNYDLSKSKTYRFIHWIQTKIQKIVKK